MTKTLITAADGCAASVDEASLKTIVEIVEVIMDSGDMYPFFSDDYSREELDSARSTLEIIRALVSPIDRRIRRSP